MPQWEARSNSAARGYGKAHRRERDRWEREVEAGRAHCQQGLPGNGSSGTCVYPTRFIEPGSRWALGHTDDRTAWIGPVHERCNLLDAASRGGIRRNEIYGPYRGDGQRLAERITGEQLELRLCVVCKSLFEPKIHSSVACSAECRKRRQRQQTKRWKAENPAVVAEYQREWKRRRSLDL